MDPTPKEVIDELNKAITNPQDYSKELIKSYKETHNNKYLEIGELIKFKTARKPIKINNIVLKIAEEIISEMNKKKSYNININSIIQKYGRINIIMDSSGDFEKNPKSIICMLFKNDINLMFSNDYDSIAVAFSKGFCKIYIAVYKDFVTLEELNSKKNQYNSGNNFFNNQNNFFGNQNPNMNFFTNQNSNMNNFFENMNQFFGNQNSNMNFFTNQNSNM